MPFFLQDLMCKAEFLKQSTLNKEQMFFFFFPMVMDSLQKLRLPPEDSVSDLIYFDNENTWEASIKSALPLLVTHLTFWYLILHYIMSFSSVCDFKHTEAIPHWNQKRLLSLPAKKFNTSFTVSMYTVVWSDAMSLLAVMDVYSNALLSKGWWTHSMVKPLLVTN